MPEILNKEITQEVMRLKGETRGLPIKQDGEYVSIMKGQEGVEKVEKELAESGYPIKYREIKNLNFYPAGFRALSLLAIKKVFSFENKDIRKVCAFQPKTPMVAKLFMRYFYSLPKIMKKVQDMWRTYWTTGEMDFVEFNEKERFALLRIRKFDMHPVWCTCMEGYFASLAGVVLGKKEVNCEESQCPSRGHEYHEFLITWKD